MDKPLLKSFFGPITKNKKQKHNQIQILESTIKAYQKPLDSPIILNEQQDKIKTLQPKRPVVLMVSSMK